MLTNEEVQRIREEEEARLKIRNELGTPVSNSVSKKNQKSVALALLWTVLFGCFGMFYISAQAGLIASGIGILVILFTPALAVIVWIISIIASVLLVQEHNKKG